MHPAWPQEIISARADDEDVMMVTARVEAPCMREVVRARVDPSDPLRTNAGTSRFFQLQCVRCRALSPGRFAGLCTCGGMLDAAYDLERARLRDSSNPYERFVDLLPVHNPDLYPRNVGYTPCVHAHKLGRHLGLPHLSLKNEGANPTASTKDRSAIISLALMLESGHQRFATASTGNAGTGYAYALATAPFSTMEMHIFLGEQHAPRCQYGNLDRIKIFALRDGSFVEAGALAAAYARANGLLSDGGFFSPGKREGAKLAFFEAMDQVPKPIDWYVQAVSSGLGVVGTYKGAKELLALGCIDRLPRLLCVQESTCAPQVRAWEEKCEDIQPRHIVHAPKGIALATHRGDPSRSYSYLRDDVVESRGSFVDVTESEIRAAREMVLDLEGIDICFNSATAVAGLVKHVERGGLDPREVILVNLTGRDRQSEAVAPNVTWMSFEHDAWVSEDGALRILEPLRRKHDVRRTKAPPAA
jgi:threonine synthase